MGSRSVTSVSSELVAAVSDEMTVEKPTPAKKPTLILAGTYTLDPLAEVIEYWIDLLDLDLATCVAPYAQIFQQLLDPASLLRRNQAGANTIVVRWHDLVRRRAESSAQAVSWGDVEASVAELASTLTSFAHGVPCLVLVGPSDDRDPAFDRATSDLQNRLAGTPNLFVERGEHAMTRYEVSQVHDPASDRFGHVPFTPQAFAALGATVARWYAALVRPPVKIIAVDGDHTLWTGVVAEDGVEGVRIDEPHVALQRALVNQSNAGRLVCLLSKNEESDVRRLFEVRPGMPLKWSHFVAHRVDWNSKPDNLRSIVSELELGLDSVVFLDDNPVECAEMRARCPEVTTVRVPTDPAQLTAFVEHLWLLDQSKVTTEDKKRTEMYRESASRAEFRRGTTSLQSFLDGLELVVEIAPVTAAEVPRLAQLTQRTNQFNASLTRCDEATVRLGLAAEDVFHRFVRVRDRFGDYGIVGQIRARAQNARLEVDLFMLSCRALGRGIEHRMLASAGEHAVSRGLGEVALMFRRGERNIPVQRFLERVFKVRVQSDGQWFRMPAHEAAEVLFDTSASEPTDEVSEKTEQRVVQSGAERPNTGHRYEHIAHALTTAAQIERAMSSRVRPRPDLTSGFVAPGAGLEREIASIWQEVLHIESVGIHDRFQDLGGKSIHLVQVHRLLLERLKVEVEITAMFEHATVSLLAGHLSARSQGPGAEAAQVRGSKMREARARAAHRYGMAR